jgi:hypothetical protein
LLSVLDPGLVVLASLARRPCRDKEDERIRKEQAGSQLHRRYDGCCGIFSDGGANSQSGTRSRPQKTDCELTLFRGRFLKR